MSSPANKKLLVVQVAALGAAFQDRLSGCKWPGMVFNSIDTVFPALTCTVQASFRTASAASQHGMIANGFFHRELSRPLFWEQSAAQIHGMRIWEEFRSQGGKVAMLFWQQSMGEDVDILLSPAPVHKHHGGIIHDCYSKPADFYGRICGELQRPFSLAHYWGPMACTKSSQWIADATSALLADREMAPDICLTYLPALDYDLQRYGLDHPRSRQAVRAMISQLDMLVKTAEEEGYAILIFGDYAIDDCIKALLPNRALAETGLLQTRNVNGMMYPDLHASRAFCMVDHEVAHIYVKDPVDLKRVSNCIGELVGVETVLDADGKKEMGIDHPKSGELVAIASEGCWFAYPWWVGTHEEPEYARHVDIHNKPGYDPCELFWGWPPGTVSRNRARIKGSHGRCVDKSVCWASTAPLGEPTSVIELAVAVRSWLKETT